VNFARAHPDDPRVPEALHLAVRSTRLGCTDDQNTKHSKAAFQLLHRNYPRSDWAAKTKYWY
jgi:TolA-binding protein